MKQEEKRALPEANEAFAINLLNRAATIIEQQAEADNRNANAFEAIHEANGEIKNDHTARTYGCTRVLAELKFHMQKLGLLKEDDWPNEISKWSLRTTPDQAASELRKAAVEVGWKIGRDTRENLAMEAMTPRELQEFHLMGKATRFLEEQGIAVRIEWHRQDHQGPMDYMGQIGDTPWTFELTRLRKDAKGSHIHIPDRNPKKNLSQEPIEIPQEMSGPKYLQKALNKATDHGNAESKQKGVPDGGKLCLIIHNQQFLYESDWQEVKLPELKGIAMLLILHQESIPPSEVWEAIPPDGFGKPIESKNVTDLANQLESQATDREKQEAEVIKEHWRRNEELWPDEEELREIIDSL